MYEDKTLVCKDCGKEFTFSAGEQEFYAEKGFEKGTCSRSQTVSLCTGVIVYPLTGLVNI